MWYNYYMSKASNISANFNSLEFACKCGCGKNIVEKELILLLQFIRDEFNSPIRINSANRCLYHNKSEGGEEDSLHLIGWAADIRLDNHTVEQLEDKMRKLHKEKRWGGLGVYKGKNFFHLDIGLFRIWEG